MKRGRVRGEKGGWEERKRNCVKILPIGKSSEGCPDVYCVDILLYVYFFTIWKISK